MVRLMSVLVLPFGCWLAGKQAGLASAVDRVLVIVFIKQPFLDPGRNDLAALVLRLGRAMFPDDGPSHSFLCRVVVRVALAVGHSVADLIYDQRGEFRRKVLPSFRVMPCRRHADVVAVG